MKKLLSKAAFVVELGLTVGGFIVLMRIFVL